MPKEVEGGGGSRLWNGKRAGPSCSTLWHSGSCVCVKKTFFSLSLRSVTLVCLYLTYSSSSFPPFFAPPPLDSSTTSETTRKWKFKAGGVSSTPPLGEEENESKVAEPSDWASSCMLVAVHSRLSSVCVVKFLLLTRYSWCSVTIDFSSAKTGVERER